MSISATIRSNLLILRGVFPKDFTTTINDVIMQSRVEPQVVYTDMPKKFVHMADWPTFSNLKCWECDQIPTDAPIFIPTNLEKNESGEDMCDPYGHFNSWNCAIRFIMREFPKEQQWDALEAVCLFESKFSGKRKEKIM